MTSPPLPDKVFLAADPFSPIAMSRSGGGWDHHDVAVRCVLKASRLGVTVTASNTPVHRLILRWEYPQPEGARYLGDHWERGYGDLEWRGLAPDRVMPWYFLRSDEEVVEGWGVGVGAAAFCFWMVDRKGVSLWLDLRNGTHGVQLGGRTLEAAEVLWSTWLSTPFQAAQALCRLMCPQPRTTPDPVNGANDWYYAYGQNSREQFVRDSAFLSSLAGDSKNRPYSVVDAGWQFHGMSHGGPWHLTNDRFPDMGRIAAEVKETGCRPGIWMRPLLADYDLPPGWMLHPSSGGVDRGRVLDPSVPEVLERVGHDIRALRDWGFEMIKHDFSTFDMLRKWGFEMGADVTGGDWHFHDTSRTSAEIIRRLYETIREAAGDAVILGCNTIGHLSAGLFELQRTGDDTSGKNWTRTRRMGINTLAFRMAQHGTFFQHDADCVGITPAVPWGLNRQWLSLVAQSSTPLFVSPSPTAIGPEQKAALRDALAVAAEHQEPAEPLDWLENTCPSRWKLNGSVREFDWYEQAGSSPFIMA